MNRQQAENFKKEMEVYRYLLDSVKKLNDEIDDMWHQMSHMKGISFDGVKVRISEQQAELNKLNEIEKINERIGERDEKKKRLEKLDRVLNQMEPMEREIFLLKYREGKSLQGIARLFYISKAGLHYRMEQALKKVKIRTN